MRRAPRPLIVALGVVAGLVLLVGVAPTRVRVAKATSISARFVAAEERAVFVGIADTRPTTGFGDLVGRGWGVIRLQATVVFLGLVVVLGLLATGDSRRRWRAQLLGAPPIG